MKNVNKIVKIVAKVLEIVHWVATGLMVVTAICSVPASRWLGNLIGTNTFENQSEFSAYGFEVNLINSAGEVNAKALLLFAIGSVLIFALMAMVFRNIYLIIKKSEATTPFNKDNIRMTREIGIFSIAVPVIGLIMAVITRLVVGIDAVETSVNLGGFVTGLVVLGLTQFFAYGAELEKDVDGLV